MIIAIIGARSVGKSHYIAVLIHEMMHRVAPRMNASFDAVDDQTRERYDRHFGRYVYENRVLIPKTRVERGVPLIYRLSFDGGRFLGSPRIITLVFFDTAGENFGSTRNLTVHNSYLAKAEGLIFLLDPLQLSAVRSLLTAQPAVAEESNPFDVIGRVNQVIRVSGGSTFGKTNMPVALTFTKLDAIQSLFPPGSPARRDSDHGASFNLRDFEAINAAMRSHLTDWVGTSLEQTVSKQFRQCAYFGVSALGATPTNGSIPGGVAPLRVDDPLLWILYKTNVIRGERARM